MNKRNLTLNIKEFKEVLQVECTYAIVYCIVGIIVVFKFDKFVKNCTWQIFNLTKWFVTLLSILDIIIINDELKINIDQSHRFYQIIKLKASSIIPAIR